MKLHLKLAVLVGVLALAAVPAMALATQPAEPGSKGKGHQNPAAEAPKSDPEARTPGPKAPLPAKAKAYGVHCRGESKEKVEGEKGTAFSRCVTAMAKAAHNERMSAKLACKELSKTHVEGEKGTEFSRCVKAANELRKEERDEEG